MAATTSATSTPTSSPTPDPQTVRRQAVTDLLARRAQAVLQHDRAGFLATVDPSATAFVAAQARVFDALQAVPLGSFAYDLAPTTSGATLSDPVLDTTYAGLTWWAPQVTLRSAIAGFDPEPVAARMQLTFVQRGDQWLLASQSDFASRTPGLDTSFWDTGEVIVKAGASCLVLGHPGSAALLTKLAADADAAVPRVSSIVGTDWAQKVVIVLPADEAEMALLAGGKKEDLAQIAALTLSGDGGTRILINPSVLAQESAASRRVVMTHELTHVAMRSATTGKTPKWLSEGLADHVGFTGLGVPITTAVADVRTEVKAGRVPAQLPDDADFSGDNPKLGLAYGEARLAYEEVVALRGEAGALDAYRAVGRGTPLAEALGMSVEQFTAAWQESMRKRLR